MGFVQTLKDNRYKVAAAAGTVAAVGMPALAFAEGESGGASATIQSAITDMAGTVATDATGMLVAVIPTLAPIIGAVIVATLGYRFVKRFSK